MKKHILTLILLLAVLGVSAQKFVQINDMYPIPYAGEPPSNAEFSATGNWAVIDIFAVDADGMDFKGDIVVEKKKITGGYRLYVYVPKADKEILILKDGVMPFHLQIPNGTLIYKKLYRVELEMRGGVQYNTDPDQQPTSGITAGHEWVDLGLLSGTLWATTNVGASNPEDYGNYFAWGETAIKYTYSWLYYRYAIDADYDKLTKYCSQSSYGYDGYTDSRTILDPSDDAATVNWGKYWCMPTQEQFKELKKQCTWTWTTLNGKNGYRVKGPNDNTIFLPAAGYKRDSNVSDDELYGYYWSSILDMEFPSEAWDLSFDSDDVSFDDKDGRSYGNSVRPVRRIE